MSDERFDRDLRAVLDEAAPRAVPDDLRRRVAAIPTADPVGAAPVMSIWRRSLPLAIGLAAAAIVIAVGLSRLEPTQPQGVGTSPGATPGATESSAAAATSPASPAVTSSSSAAATSSASPAVTSCTGSDLGGRILDWQGAAGSRIADIEITNASGRSCIVRGTPGLQLIDADNRVLIDSATAGASGRPHVGSGDPSFELVPGGKLRTMVLGSNYCGATPTLPIRISFTLPSSRGSFVAVPANGVSSDEAVPPCMGSTGSQLTMNGWHR